MKRRVQMNPIQRNWPSPFVYLKSRLGVSMLPAALLVAAFAAGVQAAPSCCSPGCSPAASASQPASRPATKPVPPAATKNDTRVLDFRVDGRTCPKCNDSIRQALRGIDGVADVQFTRDTVTVISRSSVPVKLLVMAISEAGGNRHRFKVSTPADIVRVRITGMTCDACARGIERTLGAMPCVVNAAVSYRTSEARVEMARGCGDSEPVLLEIRKLGYGVEM